MNKFKKIKGACIGLLLTSLLAACGGGGGGDSTATNNGVNNSGSNAVSGGQTNGSVSSQEPSVQLTMNDSTKSVDISVGDEMPVTFPGSWIGTNVQPGQVYLQAREVGGRFQSAAAINGSSGENFTFTLTTSPSISAGTHAGTIEFLACKDANCTEKYSGASVSVPYSLNVAPVSDWETHQRDAAHRGYVPIWLNPSRFAEAWQFNAPTDGWGSRINAVVTSKGKVYVSNDVYFSGAALYALNENNGTEAWKVSFGVVPALNPPAVSNGQVYVAVTGHEQTALWAFNADTGAFLRNYGFEGQWPHVLAPTVYGEQVFVGGGYYGGVTYSFSTVDATRKWAASTGGVWDMFTPAVDDNHVYHHNGAALYLINRATGAISATITDPFGSASDYSYHGTPVIGGRNNVLAFAKGAFSGRASSSAEQYDQRVISSFNINTKTYEWSTSNVYITAPALANGVIYAARKTPISLDAIDEATGKVLWSWAPLGNGDTSFHRNIVVTRNLLFVSTDKAVYALDLATRTPVWRYPKPGMLTISADRTLYIATGATESDGGLVAVKLK